MTSILLTVFYLIFSLALMTPIPLWLKVKWISDADRYLGNLIIMQKRSYGSQINLVVSSSRMISKIVL